MKYSKFEKLGISTSLLGFGCMRFPQTPDGKIDEVEAEKMLDTAIQAGVTYIDTAYPYHNGDSEPFVGRVLKKYDRDSFYLATKLPIWELKKKEDVKRIFDDQLERLGVDLSWKSSQIEGNTYSLLEMERLLLEKETAAGREAR